MICFEHIILSFSELIEWTDSGKLDKIAMQKMILSAIKEHKVDLDSITDRKTLEYLMGFKRFSTERVIKAVTYELTENDKWSVNGKLMGECWYWNCCVLENAAKKRCNVGGIMPREVKIRRMLEDKQTQRIILEGNRIDMEQC